MKKGHSGPQIMSKLRHADILLGQSKSIPEVCKELEISDKTLLSLATKKYVDRSPDMNKQFWALQNERTHLRRVGAEMQLMKTQRCRNHTKSESLGLDCRYIKAAS